MKRPVKGHGGDILNALHNWHASAAKIGEVFAGVLMSDVNNVGVEEQVILRANEHVACGCPYLQSMFG